MGHSGRIAIYIAALLAAPALMGRPVLAEPKTASDWNAEGVKLRKRNQTRKALEAFQRALEIEDTPRAHGQIGFVEHDLGVFENDGKRFVLAEDELKRALAADRDPWVIKNREVLEEALGLARQHLGTVRLEGGVPGAVVRIDGVERGPLSPARTLSVPIGKAMIRVEAAGHLPWEYPANVTRDRELQLNVDLVPERRDLPGVLHAVPSPKEEVVPSRAAPAGLRSAEARSGADGALSSPDDEKGSSIGRRVVALGVGALGAGALLASAYFWHADGTAACEQARCPWLNEFGKAKWGTLVGGLALGAGAVVLWPWAPSASRQASRSSQSLSFAVGDGLFAVTIRGNL